MINDIANAVLYMKSESESQLKCGCDDCMKRNKYILLAIDALVEKMDSL